MIAKSKQIKYERQKEKDKTLDLTEELDKEWRQIQPLINVMVSKNKQKQEEIERAELARPKKADEYDVLVRSLQFDSKAKPQDKLKTEEEIENERLENLKQKEVNKIFFKSKKITNQINQYKKELMERMNNELELNDDDNEISKKKGISNKNKKQTNHRSVDDMDFDDPEYLQYQNQEEIKQKRKNEFLEEREKVEEKKLDESESEDNEADQDDEDDDNETSTIKSDDVNRIEIGFKNDRWVSQLEQICAKLNTNEIDLTQFEKLIRSLITKLDPSRDEDNKKRLCLLTQHLVEFYQSLFNLKSITSAINTNLVRLVTNFIYELTSKYSGKSTKQEPSSYILMFRKLLTDLNNQYLSLKSSDNSFPQLNIVITNFLFV